MPRNFRAKEFKKKKQFNNFPSPRFPLYSPFRELRTAAAATRGSIFHVYALHIIYMGWVWPPTSFFCGYPIYFLPSYRILSLIFIPPTMLREGVETSECVWIRKDSNGRADPLTRRFKSDPADGRGQRACHRSSWYIREKKRVSLFFFFVSRSIGAIGLTARNPENRHRFYLSKWLE